MMLWSDILLISQLVFFCSASAFTVSDFHPRKMLNKAEKYYYILNVIVFDVTPGRYNKYF